MRVAQAPHPSYLCPSLTRRSEGPKQRREGRGSMGRRPATAMDWAAGICIGAAEASGGRDRGSRPATVAGGTVPAGRKRSPPGWCRVAPRPEGPRMPRRGRIPAGIDGMEGRRRHGTCRRLVEGARGSPICHHGSAGKDACAAVDRSYHHGSTGRGRRRQFPRRMARYVTMCCCRRL